jgi:hypothetical protein
VARKKAVEKQGMTCYPPAEVAAAVGRFATTELTQAIRIAAHLLGQAGGEVAVTFSPDEWGVLAEVLEDAVLMPEVSTPGAVLADLTEQAASRLGLGRSPDGKPPKEGAIADRLRRLTYPQAWAVLIAVKFRKEHADRIPEGARWWELPVRWQVLQQQE